MGNEEVDAIARLYAVNTIKTSRIEFEHATQVSEVIQHCFYCNFTLECGQPNCLWHDNTD